ncbi:TPA: glutamyl-tRNA reductase, partial [Candidatus Poribacteria bacterium]|nr:glutamyl-tRNA reductase [Candidatus Poribacteria bacterium]
VVVIGTNHKIAPICYREHLSFPSKALPKALKELIEQDGIHEGIILSTCNRVEIYAITDESKEDAPFDFLASYHGLDKRTLSEMTYCYEGIEAIKHLFSVTASLDSMVVGETQISGQVKAAFESALEAGSTGEALNRLFSKASAVQKRIRTETNIGAGAVSISYAAVQLANQILGSLADKTVLIIGAGEMAELTVQHIVAKGASQVFVVNRTYERAVKLAERFHGKALPFDEKLEFLKESDIVVSSTSARNYVVERYELNELMKHRSRSPLFLIDIAVPRDIAPDVNLIENVYLYNIDDLQSVVNVNQKQRQKEAEKVEKIIGEEAEKFYSWLKVLKVNPTIKLLREEIDAIRTAELQRCFRKAKNLSEEQKSSIDRMTQAFVNKLLHHPTVILKESARKDENCQQYINTLRKLFALKR